MKKIGLGIFVFFIWVSLLDSKVACQQTAIEQNREKIREMIAKESVPAIGVAVVKNGKTVWNESFGVANIETNTPATTNTKFGIGSISKSLTMVLAMRLAEENLLDLDAPIEKYLTDYPHKNRGVTIRLIGAHLSGYADDFDNKNFYSTKRYETTQQVLQEFYKESLASNPLEKSIYGTTTFTLIAGIIENVTKRDFVTAMNDYVLTPLKLKSIAANDKRRIIPNRTSFYVKNDQGKTVNGEFIDPSFKLAGAGFLSTAEDLAKFGSYLFDEGFLRKKSLAELFELQKTSRGEITPFALGFRNLNGGKTIYQIGGGVGISAVLFLDRDKKIAIAVLTNQTNAPISNTKFLQEIADSFSN